MFKNMSIRGNWNRPPMYLTTAQANQREEIIFNGIYDHTNYENGGIRYFSDLTPQDAMNLVRMKFLNENDRQNSSPTAKEFINFCVTNGKKWRLHGYSVSPTREDCRVAIEGVECANPAGLDEQLRFTKAFFGADELRINEDGSCYCWYD